MRCHMGKGSCYLIHRAQTDWTMCLCPHHSFSNWYWQVPVQNVLIVQTVPLRQEHFPCFILETAKVQQHRQNWVVGNHVQQGISTWRTGIDLGAPTLQQVKSSSTNSLGYQGGDLPMIPLCFQLPFFSQWCPSAIGNRGSSAIQWPFSPPDTYGPQYWTV